MRLLALFLFCLSLFAHAGDASVPAAVPGVAAPAEATLVVNNRTITTFRSNLLGSTPPKSGYAGCLATPRR